MESALSWTLTNANHHSLYSSAQTVSSCVKPSYHHILERSPFATPSVHFIFNLYPVDPWPFFYSRQRSRIQSSQRSLPSLPQTQLFPSLYLAPFKSSTKRFMTLHQHTNGLLLSTNFEGFLETSNRLPTEKMMFLLLAYDPVTTLL